MSDFWIIALMVFAASNFLAATQRLDEQLRRLKEQQERSR